MDKEEVGSNCYSRKNVCTCIYPCCVLIGIDLLLGMVPFCDGSEIVSESSLIATGTIPRLHKPLV